MRSVKREKEVERPYCKKIENNGGMTYKLKTPQRRNVPDRLVMRGDLVAAAVLQKFILMNTGFCPTFEVCRTKAREIIGASIHFTELKAPGKVPNAGQLREHGRLRKLGYRVDVVDDV